MSAPSRRSAIAGATFSMKAAIVGSRVVACPDKKLGVKKMGCHVWQTRETLLSAEASYEDWDHTWVVGLVWIAAHCLVAVPFQFNSIQFYYVYSIN